MIAGLIRLCLAAWLGVSLLGTPVVAAVAGAEPPPVSLTAAFQDDDNDGDDDFDDDIGDDDDDDVVPAPAPAPVPAPAPAPVPAAPVPAAPAPAAPAPAAPIGDEVDDAGEVAAAVNDPAFQAPIIDDDGDPSTDGFRAQQAIVQLIPGADISTFTARHGATIAAAIPARNLYLLTLSGATGDPVAIDPLATDPDTDWAELNYTSQAPEGRPGRFFLSAEADALGSGAAPEPPAALDIDAALACTTGAGVTVAVLDTGVDAAHPDLVSRIVPGGWNVLVNSADTRDLGDGLDNDDDGMVDEMTGHGTHVAGIIVQMAPDAGIMPVKVLDSDGVGDAFYVAAGIYQAIGSGAEVINLSLGSTRDARVIAEAVAAAHDAGIVVVAAAGNADRETPPEYPAIDERVFGIAATDADDAKSEFSNYHPRLFLSAPGTEVVSAYPGGRYAGWSGTSMATPWVAGAAALLLADAPELTIEQVGARLAGTADPIPERDPRYDGRLGAGRLNAGAAAGCAP